jgi:hypothetical protein
VGVETLVLDIDVLSSTEIRFVCWVLDTGVVLRSWTATTGAWPNPSSNPILIGVRSTESTTSAAANIFLLDYAGFGPERPSSCAVPSA